MEDKIIASQRYANGVPAPVTDLTFFSAWKITKKEGGQFYRPPSMKLAESMAYCVSILRRPEATGGAPDGRAAGAFASRTMTAAGASTALPPVAFAI